MQRSKRHVIKFTVVAAEEYENTYLGAPTSYRDQ